MNIEVWRSAVALAATDRGVFEKLVLTLSEVEKVSEILDGKGYDGATLLDQVKKVPIKETIETKKQRLEVLHKLLKEQEEE